MSQDLVVILTALNVEYEAVRRKVTDPRPHRHKHGTRFETGTLRGSSCRVALGLTNKGGHSAAVIAERAIEEFSPIAVVFVGVAGALWDTTKLGDVVFASHVYAYHGGTSEDDGLKARPRAWEAGHGLSQLGMHLARLDDWPDTPPGATDRPRVHFGPIAAGDIVQNSKISAEARWIREHYNDALAIEMEAAGVAQAGHLSSAQVAIIRGISDYADGTKNSSNDRNWQPRAAENAAAFATRLAAELMTDKEQIEMSQDDTNRPSSRPTTEVSPVIHNSTVGVIAGSVNNSNIHTNSKPEITTAADLVVELDRFAELLKQHHAAGDLDNETWNEALVELNTARESAQEGTPESNRKTTIALKRLRGLVADVTDLAAKLAPLVVIAGSLS